MSGWEFDMSWWSVLARSHGGLCGRGNLPSYLFLRWPPQGFLAQIFGQGHRIYVWKEVENLYATIHQLTLTYHVRGTWGKEGLFGCGGELQGLNYLHQASIHNFVCAATPSPRSSQDSFTGSLQAFLTLRSKGCPSAHPVIESRSPP